MNQAVSFFLVTGSVKPIQRLFRPFFHYCTQYAATDSEPEVLYHRTSGSLSVALHSLNGDGTASFLKW